MEEQGIVQHSRPSSSRASSVISRFSGIPDAKSNYSNVSDAFGNKIVDVKPIGSQSNS